MPPKTWGPPIWYLIHGMVYHLKTDDKVEIRELFKIIYMIISSLPCPKCSMDGIRVMNDMNSNINTRDELMYAIFQLHNHINVKLSKKMFDYTNHHRLYSRLNLLKCIRYYNTIMNDRRMRTGNITHNWNMNKCITRFREYIISHKDLFNIT